MTINYVYGKRYKALILRQAVRKHVRVTIYTYAFILWVAYVFLIMLLASL